MIRIPSFEEQFPALHQFICELVGQYEAGRINSWDDLAIHVDFFFTAQRMDEMELVVRHWHKMASYSQHMTLIHVMSAFLGLYMMPEFLNLPTPQQTLMKWIVLLHDLEKEVKDGKRDHAHAFRSAATAAQLLPTFGFQTSLAYKTQIDSWMDSTRNSSTKRNEISDNVQDNRKIPEILTGIEQLFGKNTPAALIVKTVLFHLSVNMKEWPPANPLTLEEARRYFDADLLPLLRVMHLADTDGWSLFQKEARQRLRKDTNEIFDTLDQLINQ